METAKQDASVVNEVKVAYVQNKIESLWEMEEPHVHDNLPAFPLKKCDDMYEVGLLCRARTGSCRGQQTSGRFVSGVTSERTIEEEQLGIVRECAHERISRA